jgi:hypothetical protein
MKKKHTILLFLLNLLLSITSIAQPIINEVCYKNTGSLSDEQGQYHDWIELYNPGVSALALHTYFLNDEANFETAWALPYFLLPPGEYLIIYASGTSDATAAFHAPFKLKEEGENVVLFNTNGNILDISPAVAILPNYSIGPDIHEANRWLMFDNPTPGYANSTLNPVAAPLWWEDISIETPSGIYTFPLEVLHNNYDSALSIRYTINGTEPTAISPVWEGSLRITDMASSSSSIINIPTSDTWEIPQGDFAKGTILKSAAFRNGVRVSEIKENTYFNKATAEHTSSFLILSLSSDSQNLFSDESGIYVYGNHPYGNCHQSGEEWEREGTLSVFESDQVVWSGSSKYKIHGRSSRAYPQKSIRFYADHLDESMTFGFNPFNDHEAPSRFLLKAPDRLFSQSLFVDEWVQRLAEPLNIDLMRSRPAILYINGEYWGIHQLRDRIDEKWLRTKHSIPDNTEIDILDYDRELFVQTGNTDSWQDLLSWIQSHNAEIDENIEQFSNMVDLSSFKDYMAVNLFFSNKDFPVNNVRLWKARTEESKWRFILFDCDACAKDANYSSGENLLQAANGSDPASVLFRYLMKNQTFRQEFLLHAMDLANTYWRPDQIIPLIDEFTEELTPELESQIRRWHYPESINAWNGAIRDLKGFSIQRLLTFQTQIGHSMSSPFQLYPNPAPDKLFIELISGESFAPGIVTLRDLRGSIVKQFTLYGQNSIWPIDVEDLSAGMYLVDLTYGGMKFTHRLLKN